MLVWSGNPLLQKVFKTVIISLNYLLLCVSTTSIPPPDALVSIVNSLENSGKARTDADVMASFSPSNATVAT